MLAISRFQRLARRCRQQLTLAEILSDSIVQDLMKADRIDPKVLEIELQRTAEDIVRGRMASAGLDQRTSATCPEHSWR